MTESERQWATSDLANTALLPTENHGVDSSILSWATTFPFDLKPISAALNDRLGTMQRSY